MTRPRAADDFAAIRARMKELRYERERAEAAEIELRGDPTGGGTAEQTAGGPERSARGRDGSVNPAQRAVRSRPGLLISA
jgi:hypothetical protein